MPLFSNSFCYEFINITSFGEDKLIYMNKLLEACKPIAEGDVSRQIRLCLYNEDFRSEFNPLLKQTTIRIESESS